MINLLTSPIFYLFITIVFYSVFFLLYKKTKITLLHPLILTSIILILYILLISHVSETNEIDNLKEYNSSVNIINLLIGPLTVVLAIPIYKNRLILKKYWFPILVATIVGTIVSMSSVYFLGKLFNLEQNLIMSLLPKSVTTAIAKEISSSIGAIPEITIAAVIFTGLLGAMIGPFLLRIFKINDTISSGLSFGVSSHAVGTTKAMEISEEIGAISSIAIVTTGILTMILTLFL